MNNMFGGDCLIDGEEFLKQHKNFQLYGRQKELKKVAGILMRKSAHNVLLVGSGGVGCTSLIMGLQTKKSSTEMSFDIMSKRFYWLNTDDLFGQGANDYINETFQKLRRTLSRSADNIFIIEDFKDFIDACRNSGTMHFINAIMQDIKLERYQAILEVRDEDLEQVLRCHSNMLEVFTMMDLAEPTDELDSIVYAMAKQLEDYHKIKISDEAVQTAIDLTSKYRVSDISLSRAQPERSLNLLDRALTRFRQYAHTHPPKLMALKQRLHVAEISENAAEVQVLGEEIKRLELQWQQDNAQLSQYYQNQNEGESLLRKLESELDQERKRQMQEKEQEKQDASPQKVQGFSARIGGGFGSSEEHRIREEIKAVNQAILENKQKFDALTETINADLVLAAKEVFVEFSSISKIPVDKLNQDEREKLLSLEQKLKERVYGQDEAVEKLVGAVLMASAGLKHPDKPQGAFMFCGPSGVGKTELAKSLAFSLKDDEKAMLRFDMSEYMEKHAMAKLIGAPPGYEGYEAGGILTNMVRKNPHSIILFDEVEKAHPDIFNVFLQVLDDGRLTDNRGLTVSFAETLIIMTTNIGQHHFLDQTLNAKEAMVKTMDMLDDAFRPEFLNRFNGRENIVGFRPLPLTIIEKIAKRELEKVNQRIAQSGRGQTHIQMDDATIAALCRDKYDPVRGARGIPGFFTSKIYPAVAKEILMNPEQSAIMKVGYDETTGEVYFVN